MRLKLAEFIPARAQDSPALIEQTRGGILLPPGVAEKLSAAAAVAEATALVEGLMFTPAPTQPSPSASSGDGRSQEASPSASPSASSGDGRGQIAALLDMIAGLSATVETLQAEVARLEGSTPALQPAADQAPPAPQRGEGESSPHRGVRGANPATALLDREPLFLDYETTGRKKTDRVVEIGLVDAGERVLFSTLVDPGVPIPAEVSALHHIYDADVIDAPRWDTVAPLLYEFLAGRVVVAHNAKFEAKFTPAEWGVEWVDSKALADELLGKFDGMGGLADRLQQLGLRPGPAHTAVGDAVSCVRLVKRLAVI